MNEDLRSRIPIAIGYVLIIVSALWAGEMTSMMMLYLLFVSVLHEFIQHEMRQEDISPLATVPLYLANHAIVFAATQWIPISYLVVMAVIGCIYFIINAIFMLRMIRVLFSRRPVWGHAMLYITVPFTLAIGAIRIWPDGNILILCTFLIIWVNDAGAYFTGRAWGRTKLYERISPSKSREGMIGGGILGLVVALLLYRITGVTPISMWIAMALLIWITAVMGDLAESTWKRNIGIKDSGTILRGHGGFLDRLDSFIYSVPFVFIAFYIIKDTI